MRASAGLWMLLCFGWQLVLPWAALAAESDPPREVQLRAAPGAGASVWVPRATECRELCRQAEAEQFRPCSKPRSWLLRTAIVRVPRPRVAVRSTHRSVYPVRRLLRLWLARASDDPPA